MSSSLHIHYKDKSREWEYIPVSTSGIFKEVWLPIAEKYNLEYIKILDYMGINFVASFDNIPIIIQELQILRQILQVWENISEERREFVSARVNKLIDKLRYIQENISIIEKAVL
jgi:hypothetical protein